MLKSFLRLMRSFTTDTPCLSHRGLLLCLSVLLIFGGCATTNGISVQRFNTIQQSMSQKEVRRILRTPGQPVFMFQEGQDLYECRKYYLREYRAEYVLLWMNDHLCSGRPRGFENMPDIVTLRSDTPPDKLPHEDGYAALKQVFRSNLDGFANPADAYTGRRYSAKDTASEYLMWAPLIPMGVTFLALSTPANVASDAAARRMMDLTLGLTSQQVRTSQGSPESILGSPETYAIWIYRRTIIASEGVKLSMSVGFREDKVVWIRWGYNAAAEYGAQHPATPAHIAP